MKRIQGSDVKRFVEALDQEIRGRGRGAIAAVNRDTGHSEGWWQHRANSGDITVGQMLQILAHLGLDPVKFVRRALGAEDGFELDYPSCDSPELVNRAWDRYHSAAMGSLGADFLDTLDQQRYQEPAEVLSLALWAIDHIEKALLPKLLGVAGSALRLMILLDEAQHTICVGIRIAQHQGDRAAVGKLLQRLSYVIADQGDHREALRLSERVALVFLRCGETSALGKALVDQGVWLYYLNRFEESIETHRAALSQLPTDSARNRCTAYQCLGSSYREQGNPQEALRYVKEAESIAESAGVKFGRAASSSGYGHRSMQTWKSSSERRHSILRSWRVSASCILAKQLSPPANWYVSICVRNNLRKPTWRLPRCEFCSNRYGTTRSSRPLSAICCAAVGQA